MADVSIRATLSAAAAFGLLLAAYQAPEAVGTVWLHRPAVAAGLMLAFLPVAWLVARALGLGFGTAYALEWGRPGVDTLAAGFGLALAAKGLALAIGLHAGVYVPAVAGSGASALPSALPWLALSTFVPSIAEDIVTRGFWLRVPRWRWTGLHFVVVTSALYVLNHVWRLANGPSEWAMLFAFGLAYAAATWRVGSLWAAVGLHWGWNFAGPAWDVVLPTELVDPQAARAVSGAAHLLIFIIVALAWPRRRGGSSGMIGAARPEAAAAAERER